MKLLEMISVRTSGPFGEEARHYLKDFCRTVKGPLLSEVHLYLNAAISGDIAVILSWTEAERDEMKTALGQRLAYALKRFGLVDHTCWIMMED